MIRFIMKRLERDSNGLETEYLYTVLTPAPELETVLAAGGRDLEAGTYSYNQLMGAEIVPDEDDEMNPSACGVTAAHLNSGSD